MTASIGNGKTVLMLEKVNIREKGKERNHIIVLHAGTEVELWILYEYLESPSSLDDIGALKILLTMHKIYTRSLQRSYIMQ